LAVDEGLSPSRLPKKKPATHALFGSTSAVKPTSAVDTPPRETAMDIHARKVRSLAVVVLVLMLLWGG
jgi:hypothetical protein